MRKTSPPCLLLLAGLTLILATRAAAQSDDWQRIQPRSTFHLWSVDFLDARNGMAVGDFGVILMTADSGRTWKQRLSPNQLALRGVRAIDSNTAIITGFGGSIFRSTDTGTTWSRCDAGVTTNLTALDGCGNTVWIAGQDGTLLRSTDRGATWMQGRTGTRKLLSSVSFADSLHGWCCSPEGVLLRSTDGGSTWEEQRNPSSLSMTEVLALSADTALLTGYENLFFRSGDGGRSWTQVPAPPLDHAVFGRRPERGLWAVDRKGSIIEGLEHGARWTMRYAEAGLALHGATVTPSGTVLCVGENAAIVMKFMHATGKNPGNVKQKRGSKRSRQ
jgi:photosystem II stability/assembly factor-like uncharacterized protein